MSVAVGMGYTGFYPNSTSKVRDPGVSEGQRTYTLFLHLAGLLGFIVAVPIVPTVIMWAIKKDESGFVDDHGREAMNAQISYLIYTLGFAALTPITCGVSLAAAAAMPVVAVVFTILAAISASRGEYHRYPATIRFIH
mgnify:CR=1 FL=1